MRFVLIGQLYLTRHAQTSRISGHHTYFPIHSSLIFHIQRKFHSASFTDFTSYKPVSSLQCRHNEGNSVPNHQPRNCLLMRLFRHWWNKTSKLRVTGLCAGNSPVISAFPAKRASNTENVFIWWRHQASPAGCTVGTSICVYQLSITLCETDSTAV